MKNKIQAFCLILTLSCTTGCSNLSGAGSSKASPAPATQFLTASQPTPTPLDPQQPTTTPVGDPAIFGLYYFTLGHAPDASGAQYWSDQYTKYGASITSIRGSFAHSQDADQSISDYSQTFLARAATAAEIYNWQTQLANGMSMDDVMVNIATSKEALALPSHASYGFSSIPDSIEGLYYLVLGRAADSAGGSYFGAQYVSSGVLLATIRSNIAYSTEASGLISGFYQTYIKRAANTTEIQYWQGRLASDLTLSEVSYDIQHSPAASPTPTN